jgi:hypothetical protein
MSNKNNLGYDTRDEAAMAGFRWVENNGEVDFYEYGFWVFRQPDRKGVMKYKYSTPQKDPDAWKGAPGVSKTFPWPSPGMTIVASCHTHPRKKYNLDWAGFGSGDLDAFKENNEISKKRQGGVPVASYLMNQFGRLVFALTEKDFQQVRELKMRDVEP